MEEVNLSDGADVGRFLEASTAHLTMGDRIALDDLQSNAPPLITRYKYEHGWWVYSADAINEPTALEGLSAGALIILQRAAELNCDWVKFDHDGTVYADVKWFNY